MAKFLAQALYVAIFLMVIDAAVVLLGKGW